MALRSADEAGPTLATHTPSQIEQHWRQHVYRGDRVPQLTLRALVTGALIGAVMGLSNLYVGLKVGWSLGVVVTASILGWVAWRAAVRARVLRQMPTILEANAMASTASAAGYSTGTTLVSAMAALLLVTGEPMPLWQLMAWLLSISVLGLVVAVPLKRALINVEQLPFPTGAAAAQTLRSLYADDAQAGRQARALVVALGVGLLLELVTAVVPAVVAELGGPSWLAVPPSLPTDGMQRAVPWLGSLAAYGWTLEVSLLLPAAGLLAGWRIGWSLLLGAVICFGIVVPVLHGRGDLASGAYRDAVTWTVWPGATAMTVAGLVGFAGHGRRLLGRLGSRGRSAQVKDPLVDIEVPRRWVRGGWLLAGAGCVALQVGLAGIPVAVAVLAVVLATGLTVVAARVTGETDTTPMGPLGKVAQLCGGATMPGQVAPGLLFAGVTGGAAASAADLLTDLKSGHLLGAHPRRQFVAQLVGVVVGVAVTAPVFRYVLVPDREALTSGQWPAPAARIWASVSEVVATGLSAIPSTALWASAVAAVVALALTVLERRRPGWRPWIPSATGLGLAFVLPASSSLAFFVGGVWAARTIRRDPTSLATRAVPIAAGLIAGESLMGIVSAVLTGWAQ